MVKKEWFLLAVILLLGIFWRFANYSIRWTLNQDQARDAVIALYSINSHKIPLLGPPSSAGSFSFGPIYYYVIIIFTLLSPGLVNGPWIGFTLLSLVTVLLFFLVGKVVYGVRFGLLLGLLTAFASVEVFNAPDMLNPMLVSVSATAAFLTIAKFLQVKSIKYAFLSGIFIGLAINFHLQSLGLLSLVLFALIFSKDEFKQRIIQGMAVGIGLVLSFSPLIYFDFLNKGIWVKSLIDYLLVGQNKFSQVNPVINEILAFWPPFWGNVISYNFLIGYLCVALFIICLIYCYIKKIAQTKFFWIILLSFLFQAILLKFYKGPRLQGYLVVYHPFIIFLTGWIIGTIFKMNKFFGMAVLSAILLTSTYSDWKIINAPSQNPTVFKIKEMVDQKKPDKKQIFTYTDSNTMSLPLFYLWFREGKIDENGGKIGICKSFIERDESLSNYIENCPGSDNLMFVEEDIKVFDLNSSSVKDTAGLSKLSPELLYGWLYERYKK